MDDARPLRRRTRVLRGPFGDLELRWRVRRPRAYRAADEIAAPERAPAEAPVLATTKETTWVEIQLVDEEGEPLPGTRYELRLPDGSIKSGALNYRGRARVDEIEQPGSCFVKFPDLDAEAWERI